MRSPNLRRHSDERRAAGVAEVARCIPLQLRPLPHQATSWAGARDARYRIGCARHRRGAQTAQPERQGRWRMHWQLCDRRRWVLFFHVAIALQCAGQKRPVQRCCPSPKRVSSVVLAGFCFLCLVFVVCLVVVCGVLGMVQCRASLLHKQHKRLTACRGPYGSSASSELIA